MTGIQIVSYKDETMINNEVRIHDLDRDGEELSKEGYLVRYLSFSDRIDGTHYYRIDRATNELTSWVKHIEQ